MATITTSQQKKIFRRGISVLNNMLVLATTFKIQQYLLEKNASGFRDFELEVEPHRPGEGILGAGILATRSNLTEEGHSGASDFFQNEVPLGTHELGAYINAFPLDAVAASYLFTLMEVFGDDVANIISPGNLPDRRAWHEGVDGASDLRDPAQVNKARKGFAKHFQANENDVPEIAVHRIVELKRARNEFAHKGGESIDFMLFLEKSLAVICHIVFLTTDEDRISVYPWEDHFETFSPRSKG